MPEHKIWISGNEYVLIGNEFATKEAAEEFAGKSPHVLLAQPGRCVHSPSPENSGFTVFQAVRKDTAWLREVARLQEVVDTHRQQLWSTLGIPDFAPEKAFPGYVRVVWKFRSLGDAEEFTRGHDCLSAAGSLIHQDGNVFYVSEVVPMEVAQLREDLRELVVK